MILLFLLEESPFLLMSLISVTQLLFESRWQVPFLFCLAEPSPYDEREIAPAPSFLVTWSFGHNFTHLGGKHTGTCQYSLAHPQSGLMQALPSFSCKLPKFHGKLPTAQVNESQAMEGCTAWNPLLVLKGPGLRSCNLAKGPTLPHWNCHIADCNWSEYSMS